MVIVAVRAAPVFAPTLNVTEPPAVPLEPDEMVIHGARLVAAHVHPGPVETLTELPLSPAAGTFRLVGETEKAHVALPPSVAPNCLTVNV
jgi:hypothetical protein